MTADSAAVLLAAGAGRRLGRGNKALLPLGGLPLAWHSLQTLARTPSVAQIVLVIGDADYISLLEISNRLGRDLPPHLCVAGDRERWLSSWAGCKAADSQLNLLLVHDAARPLANVHLMESVLQAARQNECALAAEPVADTLKRSNEQRRVTGTLPRESLWRAQTPQAAHRQLLLQAFEQWPDPHRPPTDEAMLVEALGKQPVLVHGPSLNFKITHPGDLEIAASLLANRNST